MRQRLLPVAHLNGSLTGPEKLVRPIAVGVVDSVNGPSGVAPAAD